ncbi:MAG: hypothetical protein K2X09_03460, partial [Rickettsiales bacterium]|nr:hypothetical protein [Rickettsiales bacterium]
GVLLLPFAFLIAGTPPELGSREAKRLDATHYAALKQSTLRDGCYKEARVLIRSGELVRVLPETPITLLAPTDLGTEILFFTPHRIVASNYHREGAAIKYVWGADKITDAKALRAHLAERKVAAILLCPKVAPEKGSLLQGYVHGEPLPTWLKRLDYALPTPARNADDDAELPELPPIHPLMLRVVAP